MRNTDVPHHFSRPSGSDNPKSRQNQDEEQQFASRWLEDMATTPAIASASNEDNVGNTLKSPIPLQRNTDIHSLVHSGMGLEKRQNLRQLAH